MTTPDWIGVDWGSTHLRAWLMRGAQQVDAARADCDTQSLAPEAFEPTLLALIGPWLTVPGLPVICCGMVGAREGWCEAPYRPVPCTPGGGALTRIPTRDPRLDLRIIPGLSQTRPCDVMRGAETRIAGFLSLNDGWDGVLCLPGRHATWVHVSAGEVVSFQTFLTGEVFALLSEASVLRSSVAGDALDQAAFLDAVSDAMSRPEALAARLFRIRAAHLLEDTPPQIARAELSGLLIGAELAAARPYWLGQQVAIIGDAPLAGLYAAALEARGAPAGQACADAMIRAGLHAAYKTLRSDP